MQPTINIDDIVVIENKTDVSEIKVGTYGDITLFYKPKITTNSSNLLSEVPCNFKDVVNANSPIPVSVSCCIPAFVSRFGSEGLGNYMNVTDANNSIIVKVAF